MASPSTLGGGTVVSGRYRLESALGSGATASVWRARDLDLGRVVAVKILLDTQVEPELARRFEREGTILGRLDHPNVVPVLASGVDEGRPYLVMALVDGVSVDTMLAAGPLPVDHAIRLIADVAAGLGAVHRAGIVHRDVKPANIVCGKDGVPRLIDFGIARVEDLTAMTRANVVLGTASYLSPEQARGEVPGPPSDVYALGCVLFQTLTGRPPFVGESALAVAYQHVNDTAPAVASLRPGVPMGLEAIVGRCLAKSPADRYATGSELEVDLRRMAAGGRPVPETSMADTAALPIVTAGATTALPVAGAALPYPATMVLDGTVADATSPERIDPSPLSPRGGHRGRLAVLAAAVVVALGLLITSVGGDSKSPAGATDSKATSTTVVAVTVPVTAAATTPPPTQAKPAGKGAKHGHKDD